MVEVAEVGGRRRRRRSGVSRRRAAAAHVEVEELRVVRRSPVGHGAIFEAVLDQMVPDVPLPDDGLGRRVDLDDRVREHRAGRLRASGRRGRGRLGLPDREDEVAVGQRDRVVVLAVRRVREVDGRDDGSVPVDALDVSPRGHPPARPRPVRVRCVQARAEERAVGQQRDLLAGEHGGRPGVDRAPLVIEEEGGRHPVGCNERVAVEGARVVRLEVRGEVAARVDRRRQDHEACRGAHHLLAHGEGAARAGLYIFTGFF